MAGEGDLASSDRILFYEYFDGESGRGLGASHFTTGLIINIINQCLGERSS